MDMSNPENASDGHDELGLPRPEKKQRPSLTPDQIARLKIAGQFRDNPTVEGDPSPDPLSATDLPVSGSAEDVQPVRGHVPTNEVVDYPGGDLR
jgi:hypothetical protein